ncbi:Imm10 family immunity protein [Isoptericola jiangsuensis]|uniref:Imm10 family immunity protein n=1 Tax=Isoptericola jiangsuensis TaxID=548579 RepID=UPI003AADA144
MIRVGFCRSVEDNYEALVLLDEPSADSIEFQRALIHYAQDVQVGMDSYAIVRGGPVHYGGLARFSLEGGMLSLELDEAAASVLELPQRVEIPVDDEAASTVAEHLPRIVAP